MNDFASYFRNESPPMAESPDLTEWPVDVVPVVKAVAQVFNLRPPAKKTSGFKLWIKAGRELLDACLPHAPAEVLVEIQREYTINLHLGRRVYDVCGPQSLVNEARRVAGQMSARSVFVSRLDEDPIAELEPLDDALLRRWLELRAEIVGVTERGFYGTWLTNDPETLRDDGGKLMVGVLSEGAAEECNVKMAEIGLSGRVQFVARSGIELGGDDARP